MEAKEIEPMMLIGLLFSKLSPEERREVIGAAIASYLVREMEPLPLDEAMKKGLEMIDDICAVEKKYFIKNYGKNRNSKPLNVEVVVANGITFEQAIEEMMHEKKEVLH